MLHQILLVVHVVIAVGIIGLILMQQGKGADMGAAFGSGASGTVFGSRGSANFLTRTTAVLATLFFISSLTLFVLATKTEQPKSIVDQLEKTKIEKTVEDAEVPVADEAVKSQDATSVTTETLNKPGKTDKPANTDVPVSE